MYLILLLHLEAFQISLGFTSEEFPSCSVYIYLSGRRAVPEYASFAT